MSMRWTVDLHISQVTRFLICFFVPQTRDHVINPEQHRRRLDGGLNSLQLHHKRFPDSILIHIDNLSGIAIHAKVLPIWLSMLRAQFRQHLNRLLTAILNQSTWNDLQSIGHRTVRIRHTTIDLVGQLIEFHAHRHLGGSSTRQYLGIQHDISSDTHSVLQIAVHFLQHILGATAQHNRARLGLLAFMEKGKRFIGDLLHAVLAALGADISLRQQIHSMSNGSSTAFGQPRVVRLAHSAQHSHSSLHQVMLRQITAALLGDHDVWLQRDELLAKVANVVLFELQVFLKVLLLRDLDVRLRFALVIFHRDIQADDAWIRDEATHLGMQHIFVHDDAVQHVRFLELTTRDSLHSSKPLRVYNDRLLRREGIGTAARVLRLLDLFVCFAHTHHCLQCQVANQVAVSRDELGANRRADDVQHRLFVVHVQTDRYLLHTLFRVDQSLVVRRHDSSWMHLLLQKWLRDLQHLAREYDDGGGAIANLFVLRSR
mmetsp:Transcript_21914/g.35184  ORF Transcript_21914/g.35184 Transcript_21914/m.35184 type:complete len:486 (+) Transcript_21914:126-1583(+)